jgi:hypothetical protein
MKRKRIYKLIWAIISLFALLGMLAFTLAPLFRN